MMPVLLCVAISETYPATPCLHMTYRKLKYHLDTDSDASAICRNIFSSHGSSEQGVSVPDSQQTMPTPSLYVRFRNQNVMYFHDQDESPAFASE